MKKGKLTILGIFFLAFGILFPLSAFAATFNNIFVFGDSLSDNGNLCRLCGGTLPSQGHLHWEGRYSNGRVWVEYLAQNMDAELFNYAYASATTGYAGATPFVPGLLKQIEVFLDSENVISESSLYVVWAGADDFLYGGTDYEASVNNVITGVDMLVNAGVEDILVINIPDLGATPYLNGTPMKDSATQLTIAFNATLAYQLHLFKATHPNITLYIADAFEFQTEIINNPSSYGLTNVTDMCPNSLLSGEADFDALHYLFWDHVHPATDVHDLFADTVENVLDIED